MGDERKFPYDAKGVVGNPVCGDQMAMFLKISEIETENGERVARIEDVRWKTYGCASAIASTSALSELVKGKTLDEALEVSAEDIAEYLGGLPKRKFYCSVLGSEALRKAVEGYKSNLKDVER